jgi:cation transport ATPase
LSTLTAPPPDPRAPTFADLLNRPDDHRRREYQYRFAQAAVFGLPVLALQFYGRSLGGPESDRWVAVLQALLAGWVVYVGAAGMLFEGLVWLTRRRLTVDLIPAFAAVVLYLATAGRFAAHALSSAAGPFPRGWFHWAVVLIVAWTAGRWLQFARRIATRPA